MPLHHGPTPLSFATYSDLYAAVAANGGQPLDGTLQARVGDALYVWDASSGAYVLAGTAALYPTLSAVYAAYPIGAPYSVEVRVGTPLSNYGLRYVGAYPMVGAAEANWEPSNALPVICPTALTSDAIQIAIDTAAAMGGGRVLLAAKQYQCTSSITLASGVEVVGFQGGPVQVQAPEIAGTELIGDGTFIGMRFRDTDLSVTPTQMELHTWEAHRIAIKNITFKNFSYAVRIGGINNPGAAHSRFENLYAQDCTEWGFWFDNIGYSFFENIVARTCTNGQWYGASVGTIYNYGNNNYTRIFVERCGTYKTRNIVFGARNGSKYNNLTIHDLQSNAAGTTLKTAAATMSNGVAEITVPDGTVFAVDLPVSVSTTANGFNVDQIYFVSSVVGNTITLRDLCGDGSSRVPTGNSAINILTYGFPALEVIGVGSGAQIQPSTILSLDLEGNATTVILFQSATMSVNIDTIYNTQRINCCTQTCMRQQSKIRLTSSSENLAFDIDSSSAPLVSYYGGAVCDNNAANPFPQGFAPYGSWRSRAKNQPVVSFAHKLVGTHGSIG